MAPPSKSSYVKSVEIPQYNSNIGGYQYQGQTPYHETIKPPPYEIASHNNAAFLHNHTVPLINPGFHGVVLQQRQSLPNAFQWQEANQNGSKRKSSFTNSNGAYLAGANSVRSNATAPTLDYQSILPSLAEDYFAAAHDQSSLTASLRNEMETQTYHKLIATGLGCLEAVLKWKLQPQREALVLLRYAAVLHEETENLAEAEEALNKGILLCSRHKMFDLMYNMQHLLARITFTINSRHSFKLLDGLIQNVEAYKHVAWVYAFRFLRVSLSLELSTHQDALSALSHLKSISSLAAEHGDKAILAIAKIIETMIHMQQSNSIEAFEQAQRSLAEARSCQLNPLVASLPQLSALMQLLDLCSTLQNFDPFQAITKVETLQSTLESISDSGAWNEDGSFAIPIHQVMNSSAKSTSGIVRDLSDTSLGLMFNWLPGDDVYLLGFLFSGITLTHKNTTNGQKAEKMLWEGLRTLDRNAKDSSKVSESIERTASRQAWRQLLKYYLQLQLIFVICGRTAWPEAQEQLHQLKETAATIPPPFINQFALQISYLEGVIHQGNGFVDVALQIFQSPSFTLPQGNNPRLPPFHLDLCTLAALNTLLIIRSPTHPSHHLHSPLLASLQALPSSPNKSLQAALHITLATASPTTTTIQTKHHIQHALRAAQQAANNQLMCIPLNIMAWKFFRGVVGEQAEKGARASLNMARKGMDRLWASVSAGVLSDTLEIMGRAKEADDVKREGRDIAAGLPPELRREEGDGGGWDEGDQTK